jgi:hypothetical protein
MDTHTFYFTGSPITQNINVFVVFYVNIIYLPNLLVILTDIYFYKNKWVNFDWTNI